MVFHKVSSQIFDSTKQNLTEGGGNHIPPPLTIQQCIPHWGGMQNTALQKIQNFTWEPTWIRDEKPHMDYGTKMRIDW
jgi:hypothetical protein